MFFFVAKASRCANPGIGTLCCVAPGHSETDFARWTLAKSIEQRPPVSGRKVDVPETRCGFHELDAHFGLIGLPFAYMSWSRVFSSCAASTWGSGFKDLTWLGYAQSCMVVREAQGEVQIRRREWQPFKRNRIVWQRSTES